MAWINVMGSKGASTVAIYKYVDPITGVARAWRLGDRTTGTVPANIPGAAEWRDRDHAEAIKMDAANTITGGC